MGPSEQRGDVLRGARLEAAAELLLAAAAAAVTVVVSTAMRRAVHFVVVTTLAVAVIFTELTEVAFERDGDLRAFRLVAFVVTELEAARGGAVVPWRTRC